MIPLPANVGLIGKRVAAAAPPNPLLTSMKGWYRLGTNLTDTSGQGNNLTDNGVTFSGGKLTGGDAYKDSMISMSFGMWSISAWIGGDGGVGSGTGPGVYLNADEDTGIDQSFSVISGYKFNMKSGGVVKSTSDYASPPEERHVVVTYDGFGQFKIYVNNSLVVNTNEGHQVTATSKFEIFATQLWSGTLRMVGVWIDRVLTAGNVTTLYGGGTPYDPTA